MVRFNAAALEVRDLNENMTISTMKRGLRRSRFTYFLDKTLLQTYVELLERAYMYIHGCRPFYLGLFLARYFSFAPSW